jgi:hypothetical protein
MLPVVGGFRGCGGSTLNYYGALAQQCFINEYVFAWTDAEAEQARILRDLRAVALESMPESRSLAINNLLKDVIL